MTSRSMLDVAYETLKNRQTEISFLDLWTEVVNTLGFSAAQSEQKIAQFYSAMMLDVRFAQLEDNMWDLRTRRTYDETHKEDGELIEDEYMSDDEAEMLLNDDDDDDSDDDDDDDEKDDSDEEDDD